MTDRPSTEPRARPAEIIFEVTEAVEGGYDAKALGYSIYTQGESWNDLKEMARDAVLCHFDEGEARATAASRPGRGHRGMNLRLDAIIADVAAFLGLPRAGSAQHPLRLM